MTPEGWLPSLTRSLFRVFLRAYPAWFRRRYAQEMLDLHQRRRRAVWREGGRIRGLLFEVRELAGLFWSGARARFARSGGRGVGDGSGAGSPLRDLRMAARTLLRSPGFVVPVVLILGLGIGANTAVFSAVDAVLLKPLPFESPGRLLMLWEKNPEKGWEEVTAAPANFLDWRRSVDAFQDVAAYEDFIEGAALTGTGDPEQVSLVGVTGNFFSVLGVEPLAGRTFRWEETWDDAPRVAVLSERFWRQRFGADPSVVGRTLMLDGRSVEVVGVVPSPLRIHGEEPAVWYPARWSRSSVTRPFFRRAHWVRPIARLEPGASLDEARSQLETVAARLQVEYPETNRLMGAGLTPLHDFLVGDREPVLLLLLGAVGTLLLLACTNVATLFLVRTAERRQELAVRTALGAPRGRVLRQMLAEGGLVAVAGGLLGVLVGYGGLRVLDAVRPPDLLAGQTLGMDPRVLAFTAAVTAVSVLLFAVHPALKAMAVDPARSLGGAGREEGGGGDGGRGGGGVLVAVEIALAVLVLSGAGLLIRSFLNLRSVDPGFEWRNRITATVPISAASYDSDEEVVGFYDALLARLEALPGVRRAAGARMLPLTGLSWSSDFTFEGWEPGRYGVEVLHREVTEGYFEAMGVPVLRGRGFTGADRAGGPPVVVINQALADEHFPDRNPVGRRMVFDREPGEDPTWRTVVGVVGSERQSSLRQEPRMEVFAPFRQDPATALTVVLHTDGDPRGVVEALRREVTELDASVPVHEVRTLGEVRRAALARDRFVMTVLGFFGVVALALASLGVYGVTARVARWRTREIGIRIAVGAARADVLRLVLGRGLVLVAIGLAAGTAAAALLGRSLKGFLFGLEPVDPLTLGVVAALLGGVGLLASILPARRATRIDPVRALRTE